MGTTAGIDEPTALLARRRKRVDRQGRARHQAATLSWAAIAIGTLGAQTCSSITWQVASCLLGLIGVIGLLVGAIAR
jgi:hypothetical protein